MSLQFRKMLEKDLDEILEIERDSFREPWIRQFFLSELQHESYLVEDEGRIIGYICAWQVMDECTITNIAVTKTHRKKGIATYMINSLMSILAPLGISYYYLEVRASNSAARLLYVKLGFHQIGLRKGYYANPTEDALVMALVMKSGV